MWEVSIVTSKEHLVRIAPSGQDDQPDDQFDAATVPMKPLGFLEAVVRLAHSGTVRTPVTLLTGGALVGGTLITPGEYYRGVQDQMIAGLGASHSQANEAIVRRLTEELIEPTSTYDPDLIYLRDVTVKAGSAAPVSLPFWCAYVDQVAGWTLDTLAGIS
jgi:hypothetical protein